MIKTGNTINKTYLFITALFVLIFMSCQSAKKNNTERQNEVELVAEKQHIHISILRKREGIPSL